MQTPFPTSEKRADFQQKLLDWFKKNKRALPWRTTYNPYHVWISEIMLQQTQMDRGVAYFLRWIERFPDVADVAEASEQQILKMWEGLGYYTRARNLHKCAKLIVQQHEGVVPSDVAILKKLPGIGEYTSAAIGSVAGNVDVAAVDANVIRILARLFDIDKPVKDKAVSKRIVELAESLLVKGQARYWNQAMMDLGGLICTPRKPRCEKCPVFDFCLGAQKGTVDLRPVPVKKKKNINKIVKVSLLLISEGNIAIQPCEGEKNLWKGLWEFPTTTVQKAEQEVETCRKFLLQLAKTEKEFELVTQVEHSYTTNKVNLFSFLVCFSKRPELVNTTIQWCNREQLANHGFSAGSRKIIEYVTNHRPDIFKLIS